MLVTFENAMTIFLPWHTSPSDRVVSAIKVDLVVPFFTTFRDLRLISISAFDSFFVNFLFLPSNLFSCLMLLDIMSHCIFGQTMF